MTKTSQLKNTLGVYYLSYHGLFLHVTGALSRVRVFLSEPLACRHSISSELVGKWRLQ